MEKIIFIFLAFIAFFVIAGSGYLIWSKKSDKKPLEKENSASVPFARESFQSKLGEEQEAAEGQIEDDIKLPEIVAENLDNEASAGQDNRIDQKATEAAQDEKEIPPAEIAVKIITRGAPAGNAEEIRNLLNDGGYEKSEIGGIREADIVQTLIFFKEEKFRREAQAVRELLIQKEKIYSALGMASSAEEKSADIVIMLGKFKEAPPN